MDNVEEIVYLAISNGNVEKSVELISKGLSDFSCWKYWYFKCRPWLVVQVSISTKSAGQG